MRLPRLIRTTLALLLITATATAAPAPPSRARESLEKLKKKLPAVLAGFQKKITGEEVVWKVNICRMIGPADAKVTLTDATHPGWPNLVMLSLRYYDGTWTTTQCEMDPNPGPRGIHNSYRLDLMLAIDEAAGK